MTDKQEQPTYEEKFERLEGILARLDSGKTPIDQLGRDVNEGAQLILELNAQLREVETNVADAFRKLEEAQKLNAPPTTR